jgi:hypothetical protein
MLHDLLHGLTAAILILTGIPFLFLASRASHSRPRRSPPHAAGDARARLFAAITTAAACAALTIAVLAVRSPLLESAVLAMVAALLGAVELRMARRACFDSLVTIPLVGLLGIAALLAIAGPQRTIEHHEGAPPFRTGLPLGSI